MMPAPPYKVFIGWDAAQLRAWVIARHSLEARAATIPDIRRIAMPELRTKGLYTRPTEARDAGYWDVISDAPMSTGHAIARFLVPALCGYEGWALFTDGDVLFRADVAELFALADPTKAVQVVQHRQHANALIKMTGHAQTSYARKNWSSVMLFHAGHPANLALTVELVNSVPGRDLHRFCWLPDDLIGALPPRWNWLVGYSDSAIDPAIVHFTDGDPSMPGYEHVPYSDEWYAAAKAANYRLTRPPRKDVVTA